MVAIRVGVSRIPNERGVQVLGIRVIVVLGSREKLEAGRAECKNGVVWKTKKRYVGIEPRHFGDLREQTL